MFNGIARRLRESGREQHSEVHMKTYSVAEFCREHGISRGLFYSLLRDGRGPRVIKAGRRTLISHEAAEEWRRVMELGELR
jgi:predicted DNA-binding transcriptional regulator AlpA